MHCRRSALTILAVFALPSLLAASTLTSTSFIPYPQGDNLSAPLLQGKDGNFYGTATNGGSSNEGTVFQLTPKGGVKTLVDFNGPNGAYPEAGLIQGTDGNFYGTTYSGGSSNYGTVFQLTPGGTLTTLVNFNGTNGSLPQAGLIQGTDGNFYGTTLGGVTVGGYGTSGTIFRVSPSHGFALTTLVNIQWANAGLIQARDGNFYGTTSDGSSNGKGWGTVFKLTPGGTLTTVANFTLATGEYPRAGLIQGADGNFYGTTYYGGSTATDGFIGYGTIFKLTPDGNLSDLANCSSYYNSETPLVQGNDGNFYGTTDEGAIFKVTPNGTLTTFAALYSANLQNPQAGLIIGSDGNFYGTAYNGAFKLTPQGALTSLGNFNDASGRNPTAALIRGSDDNYYGTTSGSVGLGTVFRFAPGGPLTTLATFNPDNAPAPNAGVIQGADGNFYGTTAGGSSSSFGGIFRLTPKGVLTTFPDYGEYPLAGLTEGNDGNFYYTTQQGGFDNAGTVEGFSPTSDSGFGVATLGLGGENSANPFVGLTKGSDGNFYGSTLYGGNSNGGTFFEVIPGGGVFTLLTPFSTYAAVLQGKDGNFYGTSYGGGTFGDGSIFKVTKNPNSTVYSPSYSLTTVFSFNSTNGANPTGALIQDIYGNFYGTTRAGGSSNAGTVFRLTPEGTLTTLVNFNTTNGANPYSGLVEAGSGNFYGTTENGGSAGVGTVYRFESQPWEPVSFGSATSIPIVASSYSITGSKLDVDLYYAPAPGEVLTVVRTIGATPISGRFTNLPDGATITATYRGKSYTFVANYSGGSGYDLTLTLVGGANP